ncbi:MAG: DVU0524 family FlgM-associated protein [Pseudomonadota bacterium]
MAITSYQVQNILRTYAKQLSRGQRLARSRAASGPAPSDQVNISIEARRKQVIEKITAEIVSNIGYRLPGLGGGLGGVEDMALKQLSLEYGQNLDIGQDAATGQLQFKVLDSQSGEVVQALGPEESSKLQERLFVITQDIIDRNMV